MLTIKLRNKDQERKILLALQYLSDVINEAEHKRIYGDDTDRLIENARRHLLTLAYEFHGYPCMLEIATRMMGERIEDETVHG